MRELKLSKYDIPTITRRTLRGCVSLKASLFSPIFFLKKRKEKGKGKKENKRKKEKMNKDTKEENTLSRFGCRWTEAEIEELYRCWGMFSVPTIAKKLNRSVYGVRRMVTKLGLGYSIDNSVWVPIHAFLQEFGLKHTDFIKKIEAEGCIIHTLRVEKQSFYMIDLEEFWKFAEKKPHLFDFSKLQYGAFGIEPDWVKKIRKENFERNLLIRNNRSFWSAREEKELIRLFKNNTSITEISRILGRSDSAIRSRLKYLGFTEKIMPAHYNSWSTQDLFLLEQLIKDGKSYETISQALNRSASSLRSRIKYLYKTESLPKVREKLKNA